MRKITTDEVADGMIVAKLIEDRLGRVILKPGDQLKSTFASRLTKWGVDELWIEGIDDTSVSFDSDADLGETSEILEEAKAQLEIKYAGHEEDSHMQILKKSTMKLLVDKRLRKHLK